MPDAFQIHLYTLGSQSALVDYKKMVQEYFAGKVELLSQVHRERLKVNSLRIVDKLSAEEKKLFADMPRLLERLETRYSEDYRRFCRVTKLLDNLGISYVLDPYLVRGLDYYHHTVFEIVHTDTGLVVCGGGRYTGVMKQVGGPDVGGIGFGCGLERLVSCMQRDADEAKYDLVLCGLETAPVEKHLSLVRMLRQAGVRVLFSYGVMRKLLAFAGKINPQYVAILGAQEYSSKQIQIKNWSTREIHSVDLSVTGIKNFFLI